MKSGCWRLRPQSRHWQQTHHREILSYPAAVKKSWLWQELRKVRNIRPSFHHGLWGGMIYSAIDTYLLGGNAPWTLHHHADHSQLQKTSAAQRIAYPKPDGKITFDKSSSVYLSNANHEENQPAHLTLKDSSVPLAINLPDYDGPEARFCQPVSTNISKKTVTPGSRSTRKIASIVKPATSRIRPNITWVVPKVVGDPITRTCKFPNLLLLTLLTK